MHMRYSPATAEDSVSSASNLLKSSTWMISLYLAAIFIYWLSSRRRRIQRS